MVKNLNTTDEGTQVRAGHKAGYIGQGSNSNAIGVFAGYKDQLPNTNVINASGDVLNGDRDTTQPYSSGGTFIAPIAEGSKNILTYDKGTKELLVSPIELDAISGGVTLPLSNLQTVSDGTSAGGDQTFEENCNTSNVTCKFMGTATTMPNNIVNASTVEGDAIHIGGAIKTVGATETSVVIGTGKNTTVNTALARVDIGYRDLNNTNQSIGAVAVGYLAGNKSQGTSAVSVGSQSGKDSQGEYAIAIGEQAGGDFQGELSVAIGHRSGYKNHFKNSIAIGVDAGFQNSLTQNADNTSCIAIGTSAGSHYQNAHSIAIGQTAGHDGQARSAVAIGHTAGHTSQNAQAVAIGYLAGEKFQGSNTVSVGHKSGSENQGTSGVAVGYLAGNENQGENSIAIGNSAGRLQGLGAANTSCIAIGNNAGEVHQGNNSVAIGTDAGKTNQGRETIAIGNMAGLTNQTSQSIILNASGSALNAPSSGFYVRPIRRGTDGGVLRYTTNDEIVVDTSFASPQNNIYKNTFQHSFNNIFTPVKLTVPHNLGLLTPFDDIDVTIYVSSMSPFTELNNCTHGFVITDLTSNQFKIQPKASMTANYVSANSGGTSFVDRTFESVTGIDIDANNSIGSLYYKVIVRKL